MDNQAKAYPVDLLTHNHITSAVRQLETDTLERSMYDLQRVVSALIGQQLSPPEIAKNRLAFAQQIKEKHPDLFKKE